MYQNQFSIQLAAMNQSSFFYRSYKQYVHDYMESALQINLQEKQRIISKNKPQPIMIATDGDNLYKDVDYDTSFCNAASWLIDGTYLGRTCGMMSIATSMSAATCGKITIRLEGWDEAFILHSLNIAKSGERKSGTFKKVENVFNDLKKGLMIKFNPKLYENKKLFYKENVKARIKEMIKDGSLNDPDTWDKTGEELIALEEKAKISKKYKYGIQLIRSGGTNYGLIRELSRQGWFLFCASAEPTEVEALLDKGMVGCLLKGYGNEAISITSGRGDIDIERAALNVLLFGQETIARKIFMNEKFIKQGLTARMATTLNNFSQINHFNIDPVKEEENFSRKIAELHKLFYTRDHDANRMTINVDAEAITACLEFREQITRMDMDDNTRIWAAKAHGLAARLACAFHAWKYGNQLGNYHISAEEMLKGIDLTRHLLAHALFFHNPAGFRAMMNADKILKSHLNMMTIGEQNYFISNGTTTNKIHNRTNMRHTDINNGLPYLEMTGWMTFVDDGSGNFQVKPRLDFFNPGSQVNSAIPVSTPLTQYIQPGYSIFD